METFKLNTKFIHDVDCYIEDIGVEGEPRLAAKDAKTGELQLIINVLGYHADDYVTVKDYSENEGLTECLINEGLIESVVQSTDKLQYTEVKTYKITDKFKECLKKR